MKRLGFKAILAIPLLGAATSSISQNNAGAAPPVDASHLMQAQAFLSRYSSLSRAQSPDFYDLYSDRAVIHAQMGGQKTVVSFQGRAYKKWSSELLRAHRIAIEATEFRDALVDQRGDRLVIQAKRFSATHCFWDLNYQVSLEPEGGTYRIVDEHLTTNPRKACAVHESNIGIARLELQPGDYRASQGGTDQSSPALTSWHRMSQEEIAQAAMHLAQDTVRHQKQGHVPLAAEAAPTSRNASEELRSAKDPDSVLLTPSDISEEPK